MIDRAGDTEPVTRLRAPRPVDRYSLEPGRPDWSALDAELEQQVYPRCLIGAAGSSEPVEVGRTSTVTGHAEFLPHGADVLPEDRLRFRGSDHDVEGEPFDWGVDGGVEVSCTRVVG